MTGEDTMLAPAKLTLRLRVIGTTATGMHLLDAELVAIDFTDRLTFRSGSTGVTYSGPAAISVPPKDDLVARALAATGHSDDVGVAVHKEIPAGAGLGGGSSDAAAVLRWAGVADLTVAARLGADVPFCLTGGRAAVSGIGEHIEPLPYEDRWFTLLVPPLMCPTPAVYAAWDDLGGPTGDNDNDLEPAALHVTPALASWRDRLGDATGQIPRLAGSGSTWFVDGRHPGDERVVARTLPPVAVPTSLRPDAGSGCA